MKFFRDFIQTVKDVFEFFCLLADYVISNKRW